MTRTLVMLIVVAGAMSTTQPSRAMSQTRTCVDGVMRDTPAGHSVFLEEDNIQAHPSSDRNYTMGLGFQTSGAAIGNRRLDIFLNVLDDGASALFRWLTFGHTYPAKQSCHVQASTAMLAGTAFTPRDIGSTDFIVGDRPYSFLLGWTVSRTRVDTLRGLAFTTEATVGTIGSRIGKTVQSGIHKAARALSGDSTPLEPRGWHHQVLDSPTGIPTARYGLMYEQALPALRWRDRYQSRLFEATWSARGEFGYYTAAGAGLQGRLGRFNTPFWLFRSDPLGGASRAPMDPGIPAFEWFGWGRLNGRYTGYNALLQGYGSWLSDYVIPASEMRRGIREYAYGATFVLRQHDGLKSYTLTLVRDAMRSSELDTPFGRSHFWGGVFFTWSQ